MQPVAHAKPELPAPDASGRITYVGSFPTASLRRRGATRSGCAAGSGTRRRRRRRRSRSPREPRSRGPRAHCAGAGSRGGRRRRRGLDRGPEGRRARRSRRSSSGRAATCAEYEKTFSNLVAEETYRQWGPDPRTNAGTIARTLRSDLVFVRLHRSAALGHVPRRVRGRRAEGARPRAAAREALLRPEALGLRAGAGDPRTRARATTSAAPTATSTRRRSASCSCGRRTRRRLAFKRKGTRTIAGFPTVEVAFEEKTSPSLVHDRWNNDVPASGRFWIDETRGTVLRTEIEYDLETEKATRAVDEWERGARLDGVPPRATLGCFVPDSMTRALQLPRHRPDRRDGPLRELPAVRGLRRHGRGAAADLRPRRGRAGGPRGAVPAAASPSPAGRVARARAAAGPGEDGRRSRDGGGPGGAGRASARLLRKAGEYVAALRAGVPERRGRGGVRAEVARRSRAGRFQPAAAARRVRRRPSRRSAPPPVAVQRGVWRPARPPHGALRGRVHDAARPGAVHAAARRARDGRPRLAHDRPPGAALPRFAERRPCARRGASRSRARS